MKNKIKIITKILLVSILLLGNATKAFAVRITWNEITTKFKEKVAEYSVTTTSDDTSINIVGKEDNSKYTFNFKYENDIVSLVPRDKTELSEKELAEFALTDTLIATSLFQTIADLYDYDYDKIQADTQEEYEEYGLYSETTKIEYTNPDTGETIKGDYIDSLSIDLDKLEKKINEETKNVDKNSQTGATTMVIAWIIGLSALIFAVVYINKTFKIEETY